MRIRLVALSSFNDPEPPERHNSAARCLQRSQANDGDVIAPNCELVQWSAQTLPSPDVSYASAVPVTAEPMMNTAQICCCFRKMSSMGRDGSGRWKWHRRKPRVESCLVIDSTWYFRRCSMTNDEAVSKEIQSLQVTRPNFGGRRWWFTCPRCGRRAQKLYLPPGRGDFACRHCHRLSYDSRSRDAHERHQEHARAIRLKFGGSASLFDPFPPKPRGMWERTYLRWQEEYERHALASMHLLYDRIREMI
jgi:hypothetical protein